MTIEEATRSLYAELSSRHWFVAVGIGKLEESPAVYIYTKADHNFKEERWGGYPVVIHHMGKVEVNQ